MLINLNVIYEFTLLNQIFFFNMLNMVIEILPALISSDDIGKG